MRAVEAEALLLRSGFVLVRTKGSHRVYRKEDVRIVVPFHAGRDLHPKVVRQILDVLSESK
jgi:predicted RNA binding protein YcfA (HicA-like mRNA interferase family)